uniref:NADH dehydrogenase subunit 2 n=1 Tax=Cavenderia fasciculata TaxID=261658 RepID=B2XX64_CACFS|nr:NADH dehydrogenase subunit 2 [Cavenderia fasciculata]ABX45186.1 NADH dehydrogenase subunit 2 [Cavenderia fasciculata]
MNSLNIILSIKYSIYIIPLMVLLLSIVSVKGEKQRRRVMFNFSYVSLILIGLIALNGVDVGIFLNNQIQMNDVIKFFEILLLIFVFIVLNILENSNRGLINKIDEYKILFIMFSVIGILVSIEATNLLVLFYGIEITSIGFYLLAYYYKVNNTNNKKAIEGSVKYFIIGGLTSTIFLLGVACIYNATGSINYSDIKLVFQNLVISDFYYLQDIAVLGICLIVLSLCIKLGLAPMHGWLIDTYEGSGLLMTLFFTISQKIVILSILITMYIYFFNGLLLTPVIKLVYFLIMITMFVGIVGCLGQQKLIRFIGYSGIINSGFLLIFLIGNVKEELISYSLYYLINYMIGLITLVLIILCNKSRISENQIEIVKEAALLWQSNKFYSIIFIITLLYLAGLPPFVGFLGKVILILSNYSFNQIGVTVGILIATVGIMVYYINIIKIIKIDSNLTGRVVQVNGSLFIRVLIILGFMWEIFSQVYIDELVSLLNIIVGNLYS